MDTTQIQERLHEQRFRLTRERQLLLELFADASSMLTPKELYELAHAQSVEVGLTTVYRLLEALTKIGVATPFVAEGNVYYTFCDCSHHHHFVCLTCHRVFDVENACPTFQLPKGFEIDMHRSDAYGTCAECAQWNGGGHAS